MSLQGFRTICVIIRKHSRCNLHGFFYCESLDKRPASKQNFTCICFAIFWNDVDFSVFAFGKPCRSTPVCFFFRLAFSFHFFTDFLENNISFPLCVLLRPRIDISKSLTNDNIFLNVI